MGSKFLSTDTNNLIELQDGTFDLNVNDATIQTLTPSMPLKTDASKKLISSNLATSDITGLDTDLQKIDNLTASTASPDLTNITGGITITTDIAIETISSTTTPDTSNIKLYSSKIDNLIHQIDENGHDHQISAPRCGVVDLEYKFSSTITSGTTAGQIRVNNVDPSLATIIYINHTNNLGLDVSSILATITSSHSFYFAVKNSSENGFVYAVTSTVDLGSEYQINVLFDTQSPNASISDTNITHTQISCIDARDVSEQASTGLISGGLLSLTGGSPSATFDISAGNGRIFSNTVHNYKRVAWGDISAVVPTSFLQCWIAIDNTGAVVQSTTNFTNAQHRSLIVLGDVFGDTISQLFGARSQVEPLHQGVNSTFDLSRALGIFNVSGNIVSANGVNLSINKTAGVIYQAGGNWPDETNPSNIITPLLTAPTFSFGLQSGFGVASSVIVPANYNPTGSTISAIGGGANSSAIWRVVLLPNNSIVVYYPQQFYSSLTIATNSVNIDPWINTLGDSDFLLIGFIAVIKSATDLSDINQAVFIQASRFGDTGAASASSSPQTLKQAYDNSVPAKITTTAISGAIQIERGTAADTDTQFEILNGASSSVLSSTGEGNLTLNKAIANLGSESLPSYTFNGDTDTGIYSTGAGSVDISSEGSRVMKVAATGISTVKLLPLLNDTYTIGQSNFYYSVIWSRRSVMVSGSATDPSYAFNGDTNTGIYNPAADTIGFSTGGVDRININSTGLSPVLDLTYDLGTAAALFRYLYANYIITEGGISINTLIPTGQAADSVAIGQNCGTIDQGSQSIAMGEIAGQTRQGANCVAMGAGAGNFEQGAESIALGTLAGFTSQHANTIILNATGAILNSTGTSRWHVSPVRTADVANSYLLMYNGTEIVKSSAATSATNKSFVIQHPVDKDKYLRHISMENPTSDCMYRGKSEIPEGNDSIIVKLPEYTKYWDNWNIQLTAINTNKQVSNYCLSTSEVEDNQFTVYGCNCKFYWTAICQRNDDNVVEPLKSEYKLVGNKNSPYKYLTPI